MDPRPQQEDWPQHPPFDTPVFETMFANLQARSDESLARHGYRREGREYRIESPNRDRRAIFCHGGFGLTRIAHLLDLSVPLVWGAFLLGSQFSDHNSS